MTRSHGFTLMELLVTLSIAMLLLALVPPLFSSGVSSAEFKSAARRVAAGLRFARGYAVSHDQETTLSLDLERRVFQITGNPRVNSLPEGIDIKLFTAQSELVDESTGSIRFFPDGSSTGGRVTLARGNSEYAVDVSWLTGRVEILE